jgi:transposase-like protein
MANSGQVKLSVSEKRRRRFSDNFKLKKVREIELKKTKVSEVCKQYEVSAVSVYKWLEKFGMDKKKTDWLIVETQSDTRQLLALKKKVAELEQIIGQKQVLLDFKDKMIDIAEEVYGIDIKKKPSSPRSNTSGKTVKNTPSA